MKRRKRRTCTYCNKEATTKDHVPPRGLFPKPLPNDIRLITVPSCKPCNKEYSSNDEYLRNIFGIALSDHPPAKEVFEATFRSMKRSMERGRTKEPFSTIQIMEKQTPSGIVVGKRPVVKADLRKILSVLERTVRGLFRHHENRKLPLDVEILVRPEEETVQMIDLVSSIIETMGKRTNDVNEVVKDVFGYCYAVTEDDQDTSVWYGRFYERVHFFAVTVGETLQSHLNKRTPPPSPPTVDGADTVST